MANFQQNSVSSAVWPWTQPAACGEGDTRREAAIQAAVMWCVALGLYLFLSRTMAAVVIGLSLVMLVTGCWFPKAFRAIRSGLQRFGVWVGVTLTWILMVPFFYIAFVPARLVLLLKNKDPLTRAFPSSKKTMWVKHVGRHPAERYERQF